MQCRGFRPAEGGDSDIQALVAARRLPYVTESADGVCLPGTVYAWLGAGREHQQSLDGWDL